MALLTPQFLNYRYVMIINDMLEKSKEKAK